MKKLVLIILAATLPLLSNAAEEAGLNAKVSLSPAGSFEGKTKAITGTAEVNGDTVTAKDVKVDLTGLKTGIELRDKHTQKHMETDKYPEALLLSAKGTGGKGEAKIKFHGVEKDVKGTYEIADGMLKALFPLKLSEFGITGIKYMGVGVRDEVKVTVVVPVAKAAKK
jgi:polyisoprenoid-binding protein YceI